MAEDDTEREGDDRWLRWPDEGEAGAGASSRARDDEAGGLADEVIDWQFGEPSEPDEPDEPLWPDESDEPDEASASDESAEPSASDEPDEPSASEQPPDEPAGAVEPDAARDPIDPADAGDLGDPEVSDEATTDDLDDAEGLDPDERPAGLDEVVDRARTLAGHLDAEAGAIHEPGGDDDDREIDVEASFRERLAAFDDDVEPVTADASTQVADGELPSWMTRGRSTKADDAEGDDDLLPAPASPLGAGRADNVPAAIGALSMRIDSLIAATTTYRSVLSDRLADYADLVNRLNRTQAADIDEFRKANERTVGEIRRSLADSVDSHRTVSAQTELLLTDVTQLGEHVRKHTADSREVLEATDKLGRFVTEALDQFAERVLIELRSISEAVAPELSSLRSEIELARASLDDLNERSSTAPIRESVDELRADLSGLRRAVLEWPDLELTRSEVVAMRADLTALLEAAGLGSEDEQGLLERTASGVEGSLTELAAVRSELEQWRDDNRAQGLEEDVAALRGSVEALSASIEAARSRDEAGGSSPELDTVIAAVSALGASLDDVATRQELAAVAEALPDLGSIRAEVIAAAVDAAIATAPPETLASDVSELRSGLLDLKEAVESRLGSASAPEAPSTDEIASKVIEALRDELAEAAPGSPSLGTDRIIGEIDELRARIDELPAAERDRAALTTEAIVDRLDPLARDVADLHEQLAAMREAVSAPAAPAPADLTDDVGELRDQVAELAKWVAELASRETGAATGEAVVAVSDEAIDALRDEVRALRRRIKVRAKD